MIKVIITASMVLVGCGTDVSTEKLTDTVNKAGLDISAEGSRLNERVNTTFEKTVSDINAESIKVKDNAAQEGGAFSERVKETGAKANVDTNVALKKANQDFLAEKAKATDNAVGSTDEQLLEIEEHNQEQDRLIDSLLFELNVLESFVSTLATSKEVVALQNQINQLRTDSITASQLEELKVEILDQIPSDCTIELERAHGKKHHLYVVCGEVETYLGKILVFNANH